MEEIVMEQWDEDSKGRIFRRGRYDAPEGWTAEEMAEHASGAADAKDIQERLLIIATSGLTQPLSETVQAAAVTMGAESLQEIGDLAQALDLRRQEQVRNQMKVMDRLQEKLRETERVKTKRGLIILRIMKVLSGSWEGPIILLQDIRKIIEEDNA